MAPVLLFINYLLQITIACRTADGVLAFLIGLCCANLFTTGQRNVRDLGSFPAYPSRHGRPRADLCSQISTYSRKVDQCHAGWFNIIASQLFCPLHVKKYDLFQSRELVKHQQIVN